jgi:hypothetical protein
MSCSMASVERRVQSTDRFVHENDFKINRQSASEAKGL